MDYLYIAKNAIPPDFCERIIAKFEESPHTHIGCCGVGVVVDKLKRTIDLHPNSLPEWYDDVKKIDHYLAIEIVKYMTHLKENVYHGSDTNLRHMLEDLPIATTGLQIQKYVPGGYFNWHSDYSPTMKRILSFIIYLNAMEDEDGGKTEFLDQMKITPKPGNILFFPSTWTYVHRGEPVKRGTKYVVTGFIYHDC